MTNMLFDPARHEQIAGATWSEERARAAIAAIAADAHRDFSGDGLWPIHPFDAAPDRPGALTTLYYGAAGVIWALERLTETGAAPRGRDYLPVVRDLARRHREDLAANDAYGVYMSGARGSFLMDETGMAMLRWKLGSADDLADEIFGLLGQGRGDARGLIWGDAGAMIAALFMHERTGELRWARLFERHCDALWERWDWSADFGCHAWTAEIYGVSATRLGALHGFLANIYPMVRGRHLLDADRRVSLFARIGDTLNRTMLRADGAANWPHDIAASGSAAHARPLVQFCSGAPGMVACLADAPGAEAHWPLETMLQEAGALVWRAGPTAKFPGLCHGAPGAGYAFLKLHARTGDPMWLRRARAFAMHAIAQSNKALTVYGRRKYSLWTGDLGLAVYLWDCVTARAAFPTLDIF